MRHIEIYAKVLGRSAASIYPVLCDFKKYPEHTDTVRTVDIVQEDEERMISSWEVNFHGGIMRWTEEDRFHTATHSISFQQITGDADHFSGKWELHDNDDGCTVLFMADFDLGIPSLNSMEPIVELALRDNVKGILGGLLAQSVELLPASEEGSSPPFTVR